MSAADAGRGSLLTHGLAALALAAAGLGLVAPVAASGGCIGPSISAPVAAQPGGDLTVTGRFFFDGCNDTSGHSGCASPAEPEPMPAARAVALVLEQGARSWTLGRADASGPGRQWRIRWSVSLPADAQPGPATLRARTAEVSVVIGD